MLVGEAAHLFPPIGAQGLNLGYRDVAALGDVLADATAPIRARDECSTPTTAPAASTCSSRTAAVDALNRTLLSDFLPVQALRGLGLFLVDRVPPLRRMAMRQGLAPSVERVGRQHVADQQDQRHRHASQSRSPCRAPPPSTARST